MEHDEKQKNGLSSVLIHIKINIAEGGPFISLQQERH